MNTWLRRVLLGLIVWAIPFVVSLFVWNVETNQPSIGFEWFNALMSLTWAIGFSIAAFLYFSKVSKNTVTEGWITGVVWYVESVVLDLIILVGLFGMSMAEFWPLAFTYLATIALSGLIGKLKA